MKKLFLLIAIVFTCSSAFAQRNIDLEATMLSPTSGATVTHNQNFNLSYRLKNMGTDTAMAGDTILMAILVDNSTVVSVFQSVLQNSNFAPDSTLTYNINYALTFSQASNGNHQICVYAILRNGTGIVDANNSNNNSCNSVVFAGGFNGIGEINNTLATDLKAFPSPASSQLTISYNMVKENNVAIKIYDIQGREVINVLDEKQGTGNQLVNVNTSGLQTGVYFYEINIGGHIARTKFVVAN